MIVILNDMQIPASSKIDSIEVVNAGFPIHLPLVIAYDIGNYANKFLVPGKVTSSCQ